MKIIKFMNNLDIICNSPLILNKDIENESNIMNSILSFFYKISHNHE